jgi:isopentenyl-diphosphate delta-isomerase type 1
MNQDVVVLVDEQDNELGIMPKALVHTDKTPLHRAFSVFLFDESGKVLVTQRALTKTTWPGIWSNSCCGHPAPGESYEAAIVRRVGQELGTAISSLEKVSDYRYRFERDGVVEHEICPCL